MLCKVDFGISPPLLFAVYEQMLFSLFAFSRATEAEIANLEYQMNKYRLLGVFTILVFPFWGYSQSAKSDYQPKRGFVPDESTAIAIAIAVWKPIYGSSDIDGCKPYHAKLSHGVWRIEGTLPERMHGGVPIAEISKRDGKILGVIHTK